MARIKHFNERKYRLQDPNHPGRAIIGKQWVPSGTTVIAHTVSDGPEVITTQFEADAEGWFEVPAEIAAERCSFPGWMNEEQVEIETLAGFMDAKHVSPPPAEIKPAPAPKVSRSRPKPYKEPEPSRRTRRGGMSDGAKPQPK